MPVRRNIVRRMVERVVGVQVWDGLRGEPVTIPRAEWDRAVDAADQLYDEIVRGIDWKRIYIEATGRHLQLGHDGERPCGECIEQVLLYDEQDLGRSALHRWEAQPTIPRRETRPDWAVAFAELIRWRRPTADDQTSRTAHTSALDEEGRDPYGRTRAEAWARYRENHPEVLAVWGQQNDRRPTCACPRCDPQGLLPRPDALVEAEDLTTAGQPHPTAAARAKAAAEQLPTVGRWPG